MRKVFYTGFILIFILFQGCSSDDVVLNSEADIIRAALENQAELLDNPPSISPNKVVFTLKENPDNFLFSPGFELSPGATINPESGVERDFSQPLTYEVTSEDGWYSKEYEVSFVFEEEDEETRIRTFSFEHADSDNEGNYHECFAMNSRSQQIYNWGTGNPGYAITLSITGGEKIPESYPTYQTSNGYEGKGVQMQTKSTGALGATFGAPLAAGNLFLGEFSSITQPDPRQGVHFGRSYNYSTEPVAIKGFFKYERGEDFEIHHDGGSSMTEDGWDAYAILFERTEEENFLRGDFSFDDPRIVSIALLDDAQRVEAQEWTEFIIPFENVEGKSFDADQDYMFTIVFSSSKEGDLFNGAVGSTLQIDEVQLIME